MISEKQFVSIVQDICELPGYDSPEDQPGVFMCNEEELRNILIQNEAMSDPDEPLPLASEVAPGLPEDLRECKLCMKPWPTCKCGGKLAPSEPKGAEAPANCNCGDGGCIECYPQNRTKESLIIELAKARQYGRVEYGIELELRKELISLREQLEQAKRDLETGFMDGAYARLKHLQTIETKFYELSAAPRPQEPRCPKFSSELLDDRVTNAVTCFVFCRSCRYEVLPAKLADFWQFFSPAQSPQASNKCLWCEQGDKPVHRLHDGRWIQPCLSGPLASRPTQKSTITPLMRRKEHGA